MFQKHADPPATKPPPLAGNRIHFFANFEIVRRLISPNSLRIDTDKLAQLRSDHRSPRYTTRLSDLPVVR